MSTKSRRGRIHSTRQLDAAERDHTNPEKRPSGIPNIPDPGAKARRLFGRGKSAATTDNETKEHDMSDPIPLTHLALEGLAQSVDALEKQITAAGHEIVVDYIGRRAVRRDVARQLLSEKAATDDAQRERAQRQAARIAEQTRRNQAERRPGVPATPGGTALADLMTGDRS